MKDAVQNKAAESLGPCHDVTTLVYLKWSQGLEDGSWHQRKWTVPENHIWVVPTTSQHHGMFGVSDGDNHHRANCAIWATDYPQPWIQDDKVNRSLWSHIHTQVWGPVVHSGSGFPMQSLWRLEGRLGLGPGARDHNVHGMCEAAETASMWIWAGRMTMTWNSPNCEWRCAKHCQHKHPLMRVWAALT